MPTTATLEQFDANEQYQFDRLFEALRSVLPDGNPKKCRSVLETLGDDWDHEGLLAEVTTHLGIPRESLDKFWSRGLTLMAWGRTSRPPMTLQNRSRRPPTTTCGPTMTAKSPLPRRQVRRRPARRRGQDR